jgi:ATP-dependent RNA helicase DDX1
MVASETGSGKTASFGLPVLQCVHERLRAANLARESRPERKSGPYNVRISANDKDSILVVDDSGFSCDNPAQKQWAGGRASHGVRGGKYYFECVVRGNGICRVGWSTMAASLELGKDTHGYGYGGTAKKSSGGAFEDYGEKYGDGDCVGCLLDMQQGHVSFTKNGTDLGLAFTLGEADRQAVMFPALLLKDCGVSLNFGREPFRCALPGVSSLRQGGGPGEVVEATSDELHLQATTDGSKRKPLALILLPTKILAKQVSR